MDLRDFVMLKKLDSAEDPPCDNPYYEPPAFASFIKPLAEFEEEEATWLIPGWMPEGQITLLAADGGVGKTSTWVNIAAGISSGKRCFLDPPGYERKPQMVIFMSTEDSVKKMLRKKLREAGANMNNVLAPDFGADYDGSLMKIKFGTPEMSEFIRYYRPALMIFDPLQGFLPQNVNMGARNQMRDCLASLIALGEETGTSFLIICHSNKRKGASGRDRVADSADIWDISRSVIMAGFTEEQGIRYLSHEKCNYGCFQETVLFSISAEGQIIHEGTSWKRDRDYAQENLVNLSAPKREDCKEWILHILDENDGSIPSSELQDKATAAGYSYSTLRRAKEELKRDGQIRNVQTGSSHGGDKTWHITKIGFTPLVNSISNPWENENPV